MSAAKVKRGKAKRPQSRSTARKPAPRGPSIVSRMLARFWALVPVRTETIERAMTAATVVLIMAALGALTWYSGIPAYAGTELAQAAGRAGFKVKRVEVTGIERMEALTVYAVALNQHSMAMPLVDLDRVRDDLMRYSWIEDARVSRRLPDTLVVDVVERKPAAIWQNNQKLSLIDDEGVVLERVDPNAAPDLPLLVGHNANRQIEGLNQLLDAVPAMKPMIAGASWVGNRRWDLRFQSGEVLALPEGDDIAAAALAKFARIDGMERLLGRGFVRFDMRDPSKFVVRVSRTGGAPAPDKKPQGG
jgi:cell division protein FtsQ